MYALSSDPGLAYETNWLVWHSLGQEMKKKGGGGWGLINHCFSSSSNQKYENSVFMSSLLWALVDYSIGFVYSPTCVFILTAYA